MEIKAISKSVRMSPRKVRLVADMIRHMSIDNALLALQSTPKRAAMPLAKTLKSAIANAVNNSQLDKNSLVIDSINISEGQSLKRYMPSTRGRIHPYKKRSSNIRIVLKTKTGKVSKATSKDQSSQPKIEDKSVDIQKTQDTKKTGIKKLLSLGRKNKKDDKKGGSKEK